MKTETRVLGMSTFDFAICFAAWVIFSIIGKPIQQELSLSNAEFGFLIATPILTGSILRPFVGALGDRFGGRTILFLLTLAGFPALYFIGAWASSFAHLIALALLLGIVGSSFAVGISYVAKSYPKERQGWAMGIFGAGNLGTAITQFAAPVLVAEVGWRTTTQWYAILLAVVAFAFLIGTRGCESVKVKTDFRTFRAQFAVMLDPAVRRYIQYYSLTFGGFVALALWMPSYMMSTYGFTLTEAGLWIALAFTIPASLARIIGGWLSDKYGAHEVTRDVTLAAWMVLFLLSYPPTSYFVETAHGGFLFTLAMPWWGCLALLSVLGVALGIGNASIFKCAAVNFSENTGVVFGAIGMGGGLGGFFLPIIFGTLFDWIGINTTCFMFLWGVAVVALILFYRTVRHKKCACAERASAAHHVCACKGQ